MANLDLSESRRQHARAVGRHEARRVLVAQALVHRPPVIVLDGSRPAGVDVELRQTLWKFISRLNREGHTIVLTTHYLEEAESLCDRIAMLPSRRSESGAGPFPARCCSFRRHSRSCSCVSRKAYCPPNYARSRKPGAARATAMAASICCVSRVMTTSRDYSRNAARRAAHSKIQVRKSRPRKMFSFR